MSTAGTFEAVTRAAYSVGVQDGRALMDSFAYGFELQGNEEQTVETLAAIANAEYDGDGKWVQQSYHDGLKYGALLAHCELPQSLK